MEISDGFAGSDIESALHEIGAEVMLTQSTDISDDFVVDSFINTSPLSRTNPEQIEDIRRWGRERAVPAGRDVVAPNEEQPRGRRIVTFG